MNDVGSQIYAEFSGVESLIMHNQPEAPGFYTG